MGYHIVYMSSIYGAYRVVDCGSICYNEKSCVVVVQWWCSCYGWMLCCSNKHV